MQFFASQLLQAGCPRACQQCPHCQGCARPHKHGGYYRWRGMTGGRKEFVQRYICPLCRRTWSVIPAGMMPYCCMETGRLEELLDERLEVTGGGARPPPADESEKDCIRRALKRLSERIPLLCGLLGQQMPVLGSGDIRSFWSALRKLSSTADILTRLARDFKTSLLGCYRSLLPHWERENLPGTPA